MKNKIFQSVLFILLTGISSSVIADTPEKEAESATEATQPEKVKVMKETNKKYEPATRFTPTEKLRADDTVTFPVDI